MGPGFLFGKLPPVPERIFSPMVRVAHNANDECETETEVGKGFFSSLFLF